jgi:hypothetical protein
MNDRDGLDHLMRARFMSSAGFGGLALMLALAAGVASLGKPIKGAVHSEQDRSRIETESSERAEARQDIPLMGRLATVLGENKPHFGFGHRCVVRVHRVMKDGEWISETRRQCW